MIAPAPEQWYSFKPMWPADGRRGGRPASAARSRCRPGAGPGARLASRPRDRGATHRVEAGGGRAVVARPARGPRACSRRSWLACRPARAAAAPASPDAGRWTSGTALHAGAAALARANLRRVCHVAGRATGRGHAAAAPRPPRRTRRPRAARPRRPSATTRATTSRSPATPAIDRGLHRERLVRRDAAMLDRRGAFVPGQAGASSSASTSASVELPALFLASPGRRRPSRRWRRRRSRPAGLLRADPRRDRRPARRLREARRRAPRRAARTGPSGSSPTGTSPAAASPSRSSARRRAARSARRLLALETGAPTYVVDVRRAGAAATAARIEPDRRCPPRAPRRERLTTTLTAPGGRVRARSSPTRRTSGGRSSSRSGRTSTVRGRAP